MLRGATNNLVIVPTTSLDRLFAYELQTLPDQRMQDIGLSQRRVRLGRRSRPGDPAIETIAAAAEVRGLWLTLRRMFCSTPAPVTRRSCPGELQRGGVSGPASRAKRAAKTPV